HRSDFFDARFHPQQALKAAKGRKAFCFQSNHSYKRESDNSIGISGADDGSISFWDRDKFDAPFRTEGYHQSAVRMLTLDSASPRYVFPGGNDAVVNRWNFRHDRIHRDPVEYERYSESSGSQISTHFGSLRASSSNGFSKGLGGLLPSCLDLS
ncbi:hypothetical protein PPTG_20496, partial [Phytophthora nicotianae INRA-310]